ncbi:hypothetical protein D1159_09195 [Pseudoflavonifractor sp. 524-17]|uniref:hypothetical protein n=1 Tax=Pseudoflavonifractor sp. 524-17 TaxID=2304577 RepID=UPI001379469B|nr:hypothetical protein [Pseudoflavonifractor sp. 524-17]NCE64759.1 hypothetical protein [Pseudoflavonifractor sp. 524-17]
MNYYRHYMDRLTLPAQAQAELRSALAEGKRPAARRRRALPAAGVAVLACCALALGWGTWQRQHSGAALLPGSTAHQAADFTSASPQATPSQRVHPIYQPEPFDPAALTLKVPSSPVYLYDHNPLELPNVAGESCIVQCYGFPPETAEAPLSASDMLSLFGWEDPADLTRLCWENFSLRGSRSSYEGEVLLAQVLGRREDSSGVCAFSLALYPDREPLIDYFYDNAALFDFNGVQVSGYTLDPDGECGYTARVWFQTEEAGVRFTVSAPDAQTAERLSFALLNQLTQTGSLSFQHLSAR